MEQGIPLSSHTVATVLDEAANRKRATPITLAGSRLESNPVEHLDRAWPDTGPTHKHQVAGC